MAIKVQTPTQEQINRDPRAFAIYSSATHGGKTPELKDLKELASKYGNPKAAESLSGESGELAWDTIVQALKAAPSSGFEGAKEVSEYSDGTPAVGLAALDEKSDVVPFKFTRRQPGPDDVHIQILKCGLCHSDLHQLRNEWANTVYPVVPGHEMTGIVTQVGANVTKFKVGQRAGVGCMVDSCRKCDSCKADSEQFCTAPCTFTYNGPASDGSGATTKGGYSDHIVVNEDFVLHVPDNLDLAGAAPLLCAGITVYSPLRHFKLDQPGMKLGVVGLGGLGHMAVKIGKAMGLEVTVFSTSNSKKEEALSRLGADHFVVSKDADQMKELAGTLDGILDTISADHPLPDYIQLLKLDGRIVMLGVPPTPLQLPAGVVIFGRKSVSGSLIGGIAETQEMLDFCGKHNIVADVEVVKADYINKALDRMFKADVKYRFVLDVEASLVQ